MSNPGDPEDFTFEFDLGGDGVPVSNLGDLDDATEDEPREGAIFPDMDDRGEPYLVPLPGEGGSSQPRPTGSGQASPIVTKVELERDATPEELEAAWNKLSEAQRANYTARPWLWAPGAAGHPMKARPKAEREKRKSRKANRVNVREVVDGIVGDTGLDPFSVMALIMLNTEEARNKLGLTERERPSLMLRSKCAMELAGYMSPKLKSIEIKDEGHKPAQVQVFLPANSRETGNAAVIRLPTRDGVQVEMSPDTAAQLIKDGLVDVPDEDQDGE